MRTNKGGMQLIISAVVVLIFIVTISFTAGVLSEQIALNKAIRIHRQNEVRLRECNAALTMQLQDAKDEMQSRESLLGWTAKYIREKEAGK